MPEPFKEQILRWVKSGKDLPVLSSTAGKIVRMAVSGADAQKLAEVILESPTLTAKILRMVNSPYYGFANKVATVQHAIVLLGFNAVRNLVLSISIVESFSVKRKGEFDHKKFCRDAFCSAIASDLLARESGYKDLDEIFVLGLLHDIGLLIAAMFAPESFDRVIRSREGSNRSIIEAEREVLGTDHTELGEMISCEWNLPPEIGLAIRFHHSPDQTPADPCSHKLAQIVYLSNLMTAIFKGEDGRRTSLFTKEAFRLLGLGQDRVNSVLFSFGNKVKELAAIFDIDTDGIKDYHQILQDANGKLGEINMEYDALLKKLRQEQEKLSLESVRLRESEERFRLLFENASDAIAILDLNGGLLQVNEQFCESLGYEKGGIGQLRLQNLLIEKDRNRLTECLAAAGQKNSSPQKALEFTVITQPGDTCNVEVKINCIHKEGCLESFQAIMRDVTERKRKEKSRMERERVKAVIEMASGAAHELAQPMTALMGLSDLLMLKMPPEDKNRKVIKTISNLTHKMAEITQKLGRITRYAIKEFPGGIKIVDIEEASKPPYNPRQE
ncbi:MAG: HDOD domain-containing protein [Pseudomonadota bacterium]